jgi:hypothetical protein
LTFGAASLASAADGSFLSLAPFSGFSAFLAAAGLRATDLAGAELIIPEAEEGFDDILRAMLPYCTLTLSIFILGRAKFLNLGGIFPTIFFYF